MSNKKAIGIIGLGAMGSRMAKNLVRAGYPVVVYNRSSEPVDELVELGAIRAESPADAAQQVEVLISIVSDNESSKTVWLAEETGAIHGLEGGTVAISSSTLTPEWSQELASRMKQRQVPFLEAPVVGTRPQAENGELVYLVGGAQVVVEQVHDVFDVLGAKTVHMGPVGTAMRMKLMINAMLGMQAAALGEIVASIRRNMEAPDKVLEMLKTLPVMSPIMGRLMGKIEPQNYAPNFPIELVEKDLRYFVEAFSKDRAGVSYVESTRRMYEEAIQQGYGPDDITGIVQLFES